MMKNRGKPAWWLLNLIVLVMLALLAGENGLPLSLLDSELLMAVTILLLYVLIGMWLWANGEALERSEALNAARQGAHGGKAPARTPTQARCREVRTYPTSQTAPGEGRRK